MPSGITPARSNPSRPGADGGTTSTIGCPFGAVAGFDKCSWIDGHLAANPSLSAALSANGSYADGREQVSGCVEERPVFGTSESRLLVDRTFGDTGPQRVHAVWREAVGRVGEHHVGDVRGWGYSSKSTLGVIFELVTVRWASAQALPCPIGHISAEGV